MKKIANPAMRLTIAGRLLQRLSLSQNDAALARVSRYIRQTASRFGLQNPENLNDLDDHDYADYVIARAGAIAQTGFDHQIKVAISSYFASLMGTDSARINALLHLALATVDIHVRSLALLATIGERASPKIHGITYEGLSLIMEGDDDATLTSDGVSLLKGDEYLGTHLIKPIAITVSTNALTKATVLSEHIPYRSEEENITSNGLAINDRIVRAMLGQGCGQDVIPAAGTNDGADESYRTTSELIKNAISQRHRGIQAAYRSSDLNRQVLDISDQVLASGVDVVLVNEDEVNGVLIALVAGQIAAYHRSIKGQSYPAYVVPDDWDLISASLYDAQDENDVLGGVTTAEQEYDVELMTPQKRVLGILAPQMVTPIIWTIQQNAPITRPLIGILSEISRMPEDDGSKKACDILSLAQRHNVTVDRATAKRIAGFVGDPQEIEGAVRRIALTGQTENLESACRSVIIGSGLKRTIPRIDNENFDIRLVEAHIKLIDTETGALIEENTLERAIAQFIAKRHRPIKILFHGLPGTSKTSLGKYIASRLGMETVVMKPSDVLGKYLGDTERRIKERFEEARRPNKFLLIDEVDSILTHRESAKNSWEKTAVNEMLMQMDQHDKPMACTTNFVESIDKAALRRFLFKVEVKPLNKERARIAWTSLLNLPESECPPASDLQDLTVSDFSTVAEQMNILEITSSTYAAAALMTEKASRKDSETGNYGFFSK